MIDVKRINIDFQSPPQHRARHCYKCYNFVCLWYSTRKLLPSGNYFVEFSDRKIQVKLEIPLTVMRRRHSAVIRVMNSRNSRHTKGVEKSSERHTRRSLDVPTQYADDSLIKRWKHWSIEYLSSLRNLHKRLGILEPE